MEHPKQHVPVLMYHQIDAAPEKGAPLRGLYVSPRMFSLQMKILKTLGYRGLSMGELVPYLTGEKCGKVVGITFDDGYLNNHTFALPTLHKYNFSATCYVVSQRIGKTNTWDEGKVASTPLMGRTEIHEWLKLGMEIGSHTQNHEDLTQLQTSDAIEEIAGSKKMLEDITGHAIQHFCYPYGRFEQRHREMATETGYRTATTTVRGRAKTNDDLMQLKRVLVARSTNPALFVLKVLTNYEDKRTLPHS
jgi:peptidoglycan/xylan/chitin deacetylase (PgdA/CDA1 family)